jgi:hypothetical protein
MSDNENNSIFFTRENENSNISSSSIVKYYKLKNSNTIEATIMSRKITQKSCWVRLNKTEMVNKETGEIKKMKQNSNRGNNIAGIKRTHKMLVRLIHHNFNVDIQTLHFVLTYAIPIYDWKKAFADFTYFRSKLKHKYKFLEYLLRYLSLLQKEQYIYIY